jgi:hypothetical protein
MQPTQQCFSILYCVIDVEIKPLEAKIKKKENYPAFVTCTKTVLFVEK